MITPINITCGMTPEEIIRASHAAQANPFAIYIYILFAIISLIVGMFAFETDSGKKKFAIVWIITIIIVGMLLVAGSYLPITINELTTWFKSWLN